MNYIYSNVKSLVEEVLDKAKSGEEITVNDAVVLFNAEDEHKQQIYELADSLREKENGNKVTFVTNRNINFTNVCYMGCKFCGFAKRIEDKNSEWLQFDEIVRRCHEAWSRGASEVCIQGGLHPRMEGTFYRKILLAIKNELPNLHIHAFSPFEIWYGASKRKMSYYDFLSDLKDCGLGSMPGTAAEILDTDIRKKLTKNKLSAEKWEEIIRIAHNIGIPSSATIMYGHIDGPIHWANHIDLLRNIQKDTGGFTEFVPLSFIYKNSPLYHSSPREVRSGPSTDEVYKMHAVARIMLHRWIKNIQVSWTKLGPKIAQNLLSVGANDLGGTLMNESISRAAGSNFGQEITAGEMVRLIRNAQKIPVRRTTTYEPIEEFSDHNPRDLRPVVNRNGLDPLKFLNEKSI